eukprot:TRINITY_DN66393_c0_g1_i1.p1 TRINITY_DN66393_c0_g1~~TRINITY_DN66393_c0_g1_i1.p1  ORF type:complete len:219 (-),score=16.32 TRINITY_DN66393_c0_g1_i1:225-854(-)
MGCRKSRVRRQDFEQRVPVDPAKKVDVLVAGVSGEVLVEFTVDTKWTCADVKQQIHKLTQIPREQHKLLVGGVVLERDHLLECIASCGEQAKLEIMLVLDPEWRELCLRGKWKPAYCEQWSHPQWLSMVGYRQYDDNNRGFALVHGVQKHRRGPYKLLVADPPTWHSSIAGVGYKGSEELTLLPDGTMKCSQMRSDVGHATVYFKRSDD